jgi:site-specific DNA-methyltransferase (adenine-specific)
MTPLKVETVKVETLTPDPANARSHDDRNLRAIKASLDQFGQRKPLVVTHDNIVLAGNGTLEAAKELGWTEISIARTPADWDYDRARAFSLADNRTAELAAWVPDVLKEHLLELDANGWDVAELGFEALDPNIEPDALEETNAEPPADPFSKLGDVWLLGKDHTVVCGSASDVGAYDALLGDQKVNMVWTDPPYGVSYVGKTKDALTIQNDELRGEGLQDFLAETLGAAYTVCKDGSAWYVAAPTGDLFYYFATVLKDLGVWRHTLVWVKDMFVMGRADYHYRHEAIFYGWKDGAAHTWNGGRKQDSVLEINRPKRNADHPTMKPIELIARCIDNSSNTGDLILDCFGGSGSTMLAALAKGRRSALIELDPRYVDVICRRFQEATGTKPVLKSTGEEHDFTVS